MLLSLPVSIADVGCHTLSEEMRVPMKCVTDSGTLLLLLLSVCLVKFDDVGPSDGFAVVCLFLRHPPSHNWGATDSRLKGLRFESRQERRENFLLHSQLSVLTLISVSVPPPCYRSST